MFPAPPRLVAGVCLILVSVTACSGGSTTGEASEQPTALTMINGEVPPGTPTSMISEVTLLDVTEDGRSTFIRRGTRAPDTRSPIHFHPSGGSTCVESGQMTLYLEGAEPLTASAGECYWMPAGLPMSGYNSGDIDAVFIDSFTLPEGTSYFDAVEQIQAIPGHESHSAP